MNIVFMYSILVKDSGDEGEFFFNLDLENGYLVMYSYIHLYYLHVKFKTEYFIIFFIKII